MYEDNADGTITDLNTGLMWEKKSDDGGIHDKDNAYTWTAAFTVHVAGLNDGAGFAGHKDWRLPNIRELASLVHYGGTVAPMVPAPFSAGCQPARSATTCSCTRAVFQGAFYWSSTTLAWVGELGGESTQLVQRVPPLSDPAVWRTASSPNTRSKSANAVRQEDVRQYRRVTTTNNHDLRSGAYGGKYRTVSGS